MLKYKMSLYCLLAACILPLSTPVFATDATESKNALSTAYTEWFGKGKFDGEFRYRYEYVDDAGFNDQAKSSTLRSRLGFKTGIHHDLSGYVQIEDVRAIGADAYNSLTNGRTSLPVVADPEITELNELYLDYSGFNNSLIRFGRQPISLDNERFIGHANWRQNAQNFDALSLQNWSVNDLNLFYAYVYKVNRILSDDHPEGDFDGNIHLLNARYSGLPIGEIAAYAYLLDIQNITRFATDNFGAYLDGEYWLNDSMSLFYRTEGAKQYSTGDNQFDFENNYFLLSLGIAGDNWSIRTAVERLSGDNGIGFQSMLSTYHHFAGWADQFIITPPKGLEDKYIWFDYELVDTGIAVIDDTRIKLRYHNFDSAAGGISYGQEYNADVTKFWNDKQYEVGLRYAFYDADEFSDDTHKAILTLGYRY